jgi:hypothetical protein
MFGSRPEFIAFLNVAVAATNLVKCLVHCYVKH